MYPCRGWEGGLGGLQGVGRIDRCMYACLHGSTAIRCNTLQHITTHGNTLQHTAIHYSHTGAHWSTMQQTAAHCNKLRNAATNCNTLQHTAAHYSTLHTLTPCWSLTDSDTATYCNTMQHAATYCNGAELQNITIRKDTSIHV